MVSPDKRVAADADEQENRQRVHEKIVNRILECKDASGVQEALPYLQTLFDRISTLRW